MRVPKLIIVFAFGIGLALAQVAHAQVGAFSATGTMTAVRAFQTATALQNGLVLVAGGEYTCSGSVCYLSSAELYNTTTGTFTATGNMTAERECQTATLLNNGEVLIAGGFNGIGTLASAELYNPSTGTFSATGNMIAARCGHTATLFSNGTVLIAGGGPDGSTSAELYNPSNGTFTATGNMTIPRADHTGTLLTNGTVLIAGGTSCNTYEVCGYASSAEIYTPSSGTFAATSGNMTVGRTGHTATLLNNGTVLVAGGIYLCAARAGCVATSSANLYNPSTGSFTATGSMTVPRSADTATLLSDGTVLLAGGFESSHLGVTNTAEVYSPSANTFTATGSLPAATEGQTATPLADGMTLVAGGGSGGGSTAAELYQSDMMGFINPKYVVVGVVYAPPGSSSSVSYSGTTSVGSTTSISNSFQEDTGFSVAVSKSIGIPAGGIADGGTGVKLTFTSSTDYTQGSNATLTNSISKSSTILYATPGTPTFSPVNSDYDYIGLWLNPEVLFAYIPTPSGPTALHLTGYAFDPTDPVSGEPPPSGPYNSGPDIFWVQVGCLDGDFSCPSTLTITNGVVTSGTLARSWAANEYTWPTGEGPGLTTADIAHILTFDPLIPSNDYTLLSTFPSTTSDGRFTKEPYPPNAIDYTVGGSSVMYNTMQTDTQSVASGASNSIKQAFGVSEQWGINFFGIFSTTNTLTESETLTWNYSWLDTLTATTTLTDGLTVKGPPDPPPTYDGPTQFLAYQDNLFGTFAFVPVP